MQPNRLRECSFVNSLLECGVLVLEPVIRGQWSVIRIYPDVFTYFPRINFNFFFVAAGIFLWIGQDRVGQR